LTHPSSLVYIGPGGELPAGDPQMRSGTYDEETRLLHEGTALDKNAIFTRLSVLIAAATLALVILGLLLGRRERRILRHSQSAYRLGRLHDPPVPPGHQDALILGGSPLEAVASAAGLE